MKLTALCLSCCLYDAISFAFAPGQRSSVISPHSTRLFYDIQRDPPNDNVWSVLTNTEKWISATLQDAQIGGGNPLSRKEVSYVCETSQDTCMVLANIFRKIKEARQIGETHAEEQEELAEASAQHERATLRQTQILVIPANTEIMDFPVFDGVVNAINQARRNARDYVTDASLERLDERIHGQTDKDWSVSVNCAHLHPNFGEKTPEQELTEMKEEEEAGEVDLNLLEYKKRRLEARQSPYPSIVVEVRAMVPPDFTPPPPSGPVTPNPIEDVDDPTIDSDFLQNLEALFSKSSLQKDGDFYDSIGTHIETIDALTPLSIAQNWIAENDPEFDLKTSAFTKTDTTHVDEAYEFVFTNLAMLMSQIESGESQKRQYLVMPNFVVSSATSLEKFALEVENIMSMLPSINGKVKISCFHPEHIEELRRCSLPIFTMEWLD